MMMMIFFAVIIRPDPEAEDESTESFSHEMRAGSTALTLDLDATAILPPTK